MAQHTLLFSAFEPSGDEHAAPVIAAILEQQPDWQIHAFGGPLMEQAGAKLIEQTVDKPTMGFDSIARIPEHIRLLKRFRHWLKANPIDCLVPTDSPAANWGLCKAVRQKQPQARIIHLVAPQLWAWAGWRIRKMKKLSDHVLCILPFEPAWFETRGMPASFVGHPIADPANRPSVDPHVVQQLPKEGVKLALLPGSRPKEIERNWPIMLEAYRALRDRHPQLTGTVAAYNQALADRIKAIAASVADDLTRESLTVRIGEVGSVIAWCDLALVTSGTATLHVAFAGKPMVAIYKVDWLVRQVGRCLVSTDVYTLPNLISQAEGFRVIPELVPLLGGSDTIVNAMEPLVADRQARQAQQQALAGQMAKFAGFDFAQAAADKIIKQVQR